MLSNTDYKYLTIASLQAQKSPVLMRHGAVAVLNGKVAGKGYNHYRSHSKDAFISNSCTCHAEIACLRNMFHNCGTNVYGKHGINIKVG
tara:strand:- start:129 stop:395 length:267 start_codon:yes stop_codon:yes gene_type:complete